MQRKEKFISKLAYNAGVGIPRNGVWVKMKHAMAFGLSIVYRFNRDQTLVNGTAEAGVS